MVQPGWYYAQGDPPGTQRYWDGELWQGQPVPAPPSYGAPQGYGPAQYAYYPESSQATTALVLGIVSIVVCGLCAPFAWYIGNEEIRAIDAGRRDPGNRGTAQAGRIIGMIVTILIGLAILLLVGVIVAGASAA